MIGFSGSLITRHLAASQIAIEQSINNLESVRMAKLGRPPFQPSDKQRGQVEAMVRYGIPVVEIARTLGITKPTLFKHFREELDTGITKANAQVGEFIFSTIVGLTIPGRPPVTDERARVTAAIFWAKTRMGWKETVINQHEGPHGGPIEVSSVRERIARRIARLAVENAASGDPEKSE